MVKEGSKWWSSDGKIFHVLSVVELDGQTWIHYILETTDQSITKEFSCYQESFLSRFSPCPE